MIHTKSNLLSKLFIDRNNCYAKQSLNKENNKKEFFTVDEPITTDLIQKHLDNKIPIGVYLLNKNNEVKLGMYDFDKNTKEDFEDAKKLYLHLQLKGFHPLIEMSGGGKYKCHIIIFSNKLIQSIQMIYFLKNICKESNIKPNEIFPKQSELTGKEYGNLIKLPLGINLSTNELSYFLNERFEKENSAEDLLKYHLDNLDEIPELKAEEIVEKTTILKNPISPEKYDTFFNYCLCNELPAGQIYDVILRNMASWLYQKKYTIKHIEKEIKPLYKKQAWNFKDLLGWFNDAQNRPEIIHGELIKWADSADKSLLKLLPSDKTHIIGGDINIDYVDNILNKWSNKEIRNKLDEVINKIALIKEEYIREHFISVISGRITLKKNIVSKKLQKILNSKIKRQFFNFLDLEQMEIKQQEFYLEPFVPKNFIIGLVAGPDSMKSFFSLFLALHIVLKHEMCFMFKPALEATKVLIYDLERQPEITSSRLQYLLNGLRVRGLEKDKIQNLKNLDALYNFNTKDYDSEIKTAEPYNIIIIDAYRRILDGNENDSEVSNKLFSNYLKKLKDSGKTVILIHHTKKGRREISATSGEASENARGSGDFTAFLDLQYEFHKSDDFNDKDMEKTQLFVRRTKNNHGISGQNIYGFNISRNIKTNTTIFDYDKLLRFLNPVDTRRDFIKKLLLEHGVLERKDIIAKVQEKIVISKDSILKDILYLKKLGDISVDTYGKYKIAGNETS